MLGALLLPSERDRLHAAITVAVPVCLYSMTELPFYYAVRYKLSRVVGGEFGRPQVVLATDIITIMLIVSRTLIYPIKIFKLDAMEHTQKLYILCIYVSCLMFISQLKSDLGNVLYLEILPMMHFVPFSVVLHVRFV